MIDLTIVWQKILTNYNRQEYRAILYYFKSSKFMYFCPTKSINIINLRYIFPLCFLMISFVACKKATNQPLNSPLNQPLFSLLPAEKTNIRFENYLTDTDTFNIIQYLYYYNGGGVAVGDINNDGLQDAYFTSNRGENKLYLNKGNLQFEDISDKAGVKGTGDWKTGVTMADVNADGWLDIYVCEVGKYKTISGKNQLFINNQDGTFSEKAKEYGLDYVGFATQAAFFDYDKDGDLDMYLLGHTVHSPARYEKSDVRKIYSPDSGDKLFQNNNGKFQNVTQKSGIFGSQNGYGLGIAVGDLNGDGWQDVYISNDFHENDYLYYNNGNGTFTEAIKESMTHTSMFSMGSDMADFNNDARPDLVTLDMKPESEEVLKNSQSADPYDTYDFKHRTFNYHHQFPANCLQLNNGTKKGEKTAKFTEIGHLSGIAATDWSWSALLADYDNDGWKDLYISNGIRRRLNDLDYLKFISSDDIQKNAKDSALIAKMPFGDVPKYAYRNNKDLTFLDVSAAWGINQTGCTNGAAYADLDNDGDLDLIVNNLNAPSAIYENTTNKNTKHNWLKINLKGDKTNTEGIGAKVQVFLGGKMQYQECMPVRGFLSRSDVRLHFGFERDTTQIDSLIVTWLTSKKQILKSIHTKQILTLSEKDATSSASSLAATPTFFQEIPNLIPFQHKENAFNDMTQEKLLPYLISTQSPKIAIGDVNRDSLEDIFICNAKGERNALFLQSIQNKSISQKHNHKSELAAFAGRTAKGIGEGLLGMLTGQKVKIGTKNSQNPNFTRSKDKIFDMPNPADATAVSLFDADFDVDLDLLIGFGGNEDPQISKLALFKNNGRGEFTYSNSINLSAKAFSDVSCIRPADYDNDGDMDVFIGGRMIAGQYGATPSSFLLTADKIGNFKNATPPEMSNIGMVTDALWADANGDKTLDLIVVGEWMPLTIFFNKKGKLEKYELPNSSGLWSALHAADLDEDGDMDFVVGNFGLNSNLVASEKNPLRLYTADFDGNNDTEPIVTYMKQGKEYTFFGKDELTSQMPSLKKQFLEYRDFAKTDFKNIFPKEKIDKATKHEVVTLASVIVENNGKGQFSIKNLPSEAQTAPVFAIAMWGKNLVLGGNLYEAQPAIGRMDALQGVLLQNNGKCNFSSIKPTESGFVTDGAVRDMHFFNNGKYLLIGNNNGKVQVLEAH
jgi:enediyne biosynthesis protein E4